MKFWWKLLSFWRCWKTQFFWVGHFEFFFQKKFFFCFIPIKISHKLCARMDGSQFLWLWWFTVKNHSPLTFQPAVYKSFPIQDTYHVILCIELHTFYFEVPDSLVSRFVLIVHPLAIGDSIETVLGWRILGTSIPAAAVCTTAMVSILMGRTWTGSTNIIWTINESSS